MPTGAALGAGILQGINSVVLPHLERQQQAQVQSQLQNTGILKKELQGVIEQSMEAGIFEPSDPDSQEALQYLYHGSYGTKEPENLGRFLATSRYKLQQMEAAVPQAQESLQNPQPAPAMTPAPQSSAALSPDEEPAFQEWYADRAKATGLNPNPDAPQHKYDYRAAFKAGAEPAISQEDGKYHWDSRFKMADHPNRYVNGIDTITGQPVEPLVFGKTPEERGALRIAQKQNNGISTTIRHKNTSVVFPGLTFTEREKLGANRALRDALNDVPLEQALAKVNDPKLREGVKKAWGLEYLSRLATAGISLQDAVESIAAQGGIDAIPKRAYEMVYGPQLAGAKAAASAEGAMPAKVETARRTAEATIPAKVDLARQTAEATLPSKVELAKQTAEVQAPVKVETARQTAQATSPIRVDTAKQISENNHRLTNEYAKDERTLVGKALGIDMSKPLSDLEAGDLLDALDRRKARAAHGKLVDKLTTTQDAKATERVPATELASLYDPESGTPIAPALRGGGVKIITRADVDAAGAVPLDKGGVEILRAAPKTNLILDQYASAALKVFQSENPNVNLGSYYTKWLTANTDYQDLLSENGKLATMIRALGEKGALAEGDVDRGENALLMLRGRVSKSQIVQSIEEIHTIIAQGVQSLGFNAAKIVPRPQALPMPTAAPDPNWVE